MVMSLEVTLRMVDLVLDLRLCERGCVHLVLGGLSVLLMAGPRRISLVLVVVFCCFIFLVVFFNPGFPWLGEGEGDPEYTRNCALLSIPVIAGAWGWSLHTTLLHHTTQCSEVVSHSADMIARRQKKSMRAKKTH